VHCFAGVSRSSSCVIAFLMRELGKSYWDALYFTRNRRSIICPNMGFAKQLQEYEAQIKWRKQREEAKKSPVKETIKESLSKS